MNENIQKLIDVVKTYTYKDTSTETEIDEIINNFANMKPFELTEEEIKIARSTIHAENLIKLDLGEALISKQHVKWFYERKKDLNMKYWKRYEQYLLHDKKFPIPVVKTMDEVSDELTDLLGDPNVEEKFQRRGLIIGDVQSGKTANYTGLICKAADAGYKVIVLLTGTIESLRQQTQLRIDEGFTGIDSDAMKKQKTDKLVGVGKHDNTLRTAVLTTKSDDFNTKFANNLGLFLNTLKDPVIFVIKKNVTVLERLNQWLKQINLDPGRKYINNSLLMIDDEADNASINTNKEDCDPTRTNAQIVEMLGLFKKASYVGFTATPYANVFINPDTKDDMEKENLFPKDYIYCLDAPTNYIGAKDIYDEDSKYYSMLEPIRDGEIYPLNHKIDFVVEKLSESLKKAINEFLIVNAIRDLRGDTTTHRSMLVNISRFVKVQKQFGDIISDYVEDIKKSVKLYSKLDLDNSLKDEHIKFLYETFISSYGYVEFDWNQIIKIIDESISPIEVKVVNTKNKDSLNYQENEKNGLRVIAIGGMGLSRGLTLEGLVISYFHRNSKMYDTLMQMGRWFGYRPNYDDLCKVWMSNENIFYYKEISEATSELKRDIKHMRELGKTPLEFGLRVRNDEQTLMITARNKMRTASNYKRAQSLSQVVVETPRINNDPINNTTNLSAVENLLYAIKLNKYRCKKIGTSCGYERIKKDIIIDFLKNYEASYANLRFNAETIMNFIEKYDGDELNLWDVVFINGESSKDPYIIDENYSVNLVQRSFMFRNNDKVIQLSKERNRLGNPGDSVFGLSKEQLDEVKEKYYSDHPDKIGKIIPQIAYFRIKRNPLLMIYLLDLNKEDGDNEKLFIKDKDPIVGISIGIPTLLNEETSYANYKINLIAYRQFENFEEYDNEEDEEVND